MPRIRTIKPEFPQSESMGRISREARLCFILLWTAVDDSGRTRASSRLLASLLYPYDEDAPKVIGKWLAELEAENCIVRYEVEGNSYLQICKWLTHQKIDRPSESRIPAFDESSRILANPRAALAADLVPSISTKDPVPQHPQLPGWLAKELWQALLEMRKKIKKPATPYAEKLLLKKIVQGWDDGYDAVAAIEGSIASNWQDVYFNEKTPKRKPTLRPATEEEMSAQWEAMRA